MLLIFLFLTCCLATFDCSFDCSRGSCNLAGDESNNIVQLKCVEWTSYTSSGGSFNYWAWLCILNLPYKGKITMCNQTGCIPPFGCTIESFVEHSDNCVKHDSFCESETKVCCKNDFDCDKFLHKCQPTDNLIFNTTTSSTTTSTSTPAAAVPSEVVIFLIVFLSILLLSSLIIFILCILRMRKNRMYQPIQQ